MRFWIWNFVSSIFFSYPEKIIIVGYLESLMFRQLLHVGKRSLSTDNPLKPTVFALSTNLANLQSQLLEFLVLNQSTSTTS